MTTPTQSLAYCTPAQYLDQFGASEATMLLQDEERTLEQAWLVALVNGSTSDLSTLRAPQLAVADSALARLNRALTESKNLIDGYLRSAGLALPLSDEQIGQTPLITCNAVLARCWLMDDSDNATELAEKRCEKERAWLRDIATKKVSLFANDAASAIGASANEVRHGRVPSDFDHGSKWSGYPS